MTRKKPGTSARVAVLSPSFSKNKVLISQIRRHFPAVTLNSDGIRFRTPDDIAKFAGNAHGIVVGLEPIDAKTISKLPQLEIVAKYGVGLENIDLTELRKHGIRLGHTAGINRHSVAEHTIGLMIGLARNLFFSSRKLVQGTWEKNGGNMLAHKTVGVIGAGNIGKEVIRMLKPFGCRLIANDIIGQPDYYRKNNVLEADFKTLIKKSDIVTLHVPLTEKTKYMINEKTLNMMKKDAFLVNTSRGSIVDTKALKHALANKTIAGAAIDVFEQEPCEDMELLQLENLVATPHIAGNSSEAVVAMGMSAIGHLVAHFSMHKERFKNR